jgi:hypothetical protein
MFLVPIIVTSPLAYRQSLNKEMLQRKKDYNGTKSIYSARRRRVWDNLENVPTPKLVT